MSRRQSRPPPKVSLNRLDAVLQLGHKESIAARYTQEGVVTVYDKEEMKLFMTKYTYENVVTADDKEKMESFMIFDWVYLRPAIESLRSSTRLSNVLGDVSKIYDDFTSDSVADNKRLLETLTKKCQLHIEKYNEEVAGPMGQGHTHQAHHIDALTEIKRLCDERLAEVGGVD